MYRFYKVSIINIATWLFVASFFIIQVENGGSKGPFFTIPLYRVEPFLILLMGTLAYYYEGRSIYVTKKIVSLVLLLAVIQISYLLLVNVYPISGNLTDYVRSSALVYGYIISAAVYSCVLYNEATLINVFYLVGKLCLGLGILGLLFYKVTEYPVLVDLSYGSARAQAFFTEPSATAPAVAAIVMIAWKRCDLLGIALALVFGATASSPTVVLVSLLSVIGVYLLRRGPKMLMAGLLVTAAPIVVFIMSGGLQWVQASPYFGITAKRLASGLESVITLAQAGYNPRFRGALNVFEHLRENNLLWTGYGLNSVNPYFNNLYAGTGEATQSYSFLILIFFSYGIIGVTSVLILSYKSAVKMYRANSDLVYIFVPFFLTSMVNSAGGFVTYKLFLVGLFVYGFQCK